MNLKQLSAMLQLSQTTVSRALNGYPEVSEETRRRVVDAARHHGYRPNPSARQLATGETGMIGYIMPTGDMVDIDPHFVEFLSGIGAFARAQGLDLSLSPTSVEDEMATYRRVVGSKQVDALYVSAPRPGDKRITLLDQLDMPYIVHGRAEGLPFQYPHLDIDNEGAFRAAGDLFIQLGHRRIGLINGEVTQTYAIFRERGLRRALTSRGLTLPDTLVRSLPMTDESGYRAARELLEQTPRPTAIVCSSLIMTLGVFRAARELGIDIPGALSVIAHDDVFPWLKPENFSVPLTTTRSSIRAAGERIAERLAARIAGAEGQPIGEIWPVELIVRASIASAPD